MFVMSGDTLTAQSDSINFEIAFYAKMEPDRKAALKLFHLVSVSLLKFLHAVQ